jgi:uncharacterized protein (DUF1800 family)
MKKFINSVGVFLVVGSLLSGCGGGTSSSTTTTLAQENTPKDDTSTNDAQNQNPQTKQDQTNKGVGVYLDAPVEGLGYECGKYKDFTDSNGTFYYELNRGCTFRVGSMVIREISGDKFKDKKVILQELDESIARLLLSLDSNPDPDKIKIDPIIVSELNSSKYQTKIDEIQINKTLTELKESLKEKGLKIDIKPASREYVISHLQKSLEQYSKEKNLIKLGELNTSKESNSQMVTITNTNKPESRPTNLGSNLSIDEFDYIPKGDNLTDEMAIRFLNMATFGHTQELVQELREKGVVKWVDEQLNIPYNPKSESVLRKTIVMSLTSYPQEFKYTFRDGTVESFELNDTTIDMAINNPTYDFNRHRGPFNASGKMGFWVEQALLNIMLTTKAQLRHRVAYALHQWVVASQSLDGFFFRRMDALAYYYDLLIKNAFGKYQDMLYDVSVSPAMGTFLTYLNNQKLHQAGENTIYPDENYGREIMQLFSVGLYQLNMDGSIKTGSDGKYIYNFSEDDVKEMSRVFTGFVLNKRFPKDIEWGLGVHRPMLCKDSWHDNQSKTVMGQVLPAGQDCYGDTRNAVEMLTKHPSFYPYVAKKLIMRLTESNPTSDYILRVAEALRDSDNSLKEAVRAVLLDPELWENITKGKSTKLKEPFLAYMQMFRTLDAKPKYETHFGDKNSIMLKNTYFFPNFQTYIFQKPLYSPTVFNYYSDDFIPNDSEFKVRGFVAPELEIQTRGYQTGYSQFIYRHFTSWNTMGHEYTFIKDILIENGLEDPDPYKYGDVEGGSVKIDPRTNVIFDMGFAYDAAREAIGGDLSKIPAWNDPKAKEVWPGVIGAICDAISLRLTGKKMPEDAKEGVVYELTNNPSTKFAYRNQHHLRSVYIYWIVPIVQIILNSPEYLVN